MNFQISNEIALHPFVETDAAQIFAIVKSNYKHLRPFLQWVTPEYSLESAREFIEKSQKEIEENTNQVFGIFYQKSLVGAIGFVGFDWENKRTEIGYWIASDFEGKGIITKCCKYLVDYVFDELNMNRVEIRCATENNKSRAVPERLGFNLEGILRQSIWRHTRFFDMAIYAILAEEWKISEKSVTKSFNLTTDNY